MKKADFRAAGEACEATFGPIRGLKERKASTALYSQQKNIDFCVHSTLPRVSCKNETNKQTNNNNNKN